MPGSLGADPNWSKCLKCAAVDRARMLATPPLTRSNICTSCFKQYCFDPANPPNQSELVGRNLNYSNPDPRHSSKADVVVVRQNNVVIGMAVGLLMMTQLF